MFTRITIVLLACLIFSEVRQCVITHASLHISEQLQRGSIRGTVKDKTGAVVSNARVLVRDFTGVVEEVTTDGAGRFSVGNLLPGEYEVTVVFSGYKQIRIGKVQIGVGQAKELSVVLQNGGDVPEGTPKTTTSSDKGSGTTPTKADTSKTATTDNSNKAPTSDNASKASGKDNTNKAPRRDNTSKAPGRDNTSKNRQRKGVVEATARSFDNDITLRNWLDSEAKEAKLLFRIVPVKDGASIFIFEQTKAKNKIRYQINLVNTPLNGDELLARIEQDRDKTFVGVHRLGETSHLLVFYGK
jgi:hypothetical protein